jgi:hypothetical protein
MRVAGTFCEKKINELPCLVGVSGWRQIGPNAAPRLASFLPSRGEIKAEHHSP